MPESEVNSVTTAVARSDIASDAASLIIRSISSSTPKPMPSLQTMLSTRVILFRIVPNFSYHFISSNYKGYCTFNLSVQPSPNLILRERKTNTQLRYQFIRVNIICHFQIRLFFDINVQMFTHKIIY